MSILVLPRTLLGPPNRKCIDSWRSLTGPAFYHGGKSAFYPVVFTGKYSVERGGLQSAGKVLWEDKLHIAGFLFATLVLAPLADSTASLPSLSSNVVDLDFYILYPDDDDDDDEKKDGVLKRNAKRAIRFLKGSTSDNTRLVISRDNWVNPKSRDIAMSKGVETLIKTLRQLKSEGRRVRNLRIMGHGSEGSIGGDSGNTIDVEALREHEAPSQPIVTSS